MTFGFVNPRPPLQDLRIGGSVSGGYMEILCEVGSCEAATRRRLIAVLRRSLSANVSRPAEGRQPSRVGAQSQRRGTASRVAKRRRQPLALDAVRRHWQLALELGWPVQLIRVGLRA